MKQYLDILQKILDEGVEKESGRENMPNTIGVSKADISMNMKDGFPLLTTKKMYWKGIVHELLWFLQGETNIKYLVDNNVNIWNGDAYRWYLKQAKDRGFESEYNTIDEFINAVKNTNYELKDGENVSNWIGGHWDSQYKLGDLGKVYGYQWRNQNGVDQIKDVIDGLKTNPYSRYHIIDGWNKADFPDMALPPCHLLYQFIVRPLTLEEREYIANKRGIISRNEYEGLYGKENTDRDYFNRILEENNVPKFYLDLNMYQRSVDSFLGLAFNLASMSLFLMIIAKTTNMVAGIANWIGGDTHLYVNHLEQAKEQLTREPYKLPNMKINKELSSLKDIMNLTIDDFELIDYKFHPTLKAELFTGLKK